MAQKYERGVYLPATQEMQENVHWKVSIILHPTIINSLTAIKIILQQ
jgi:hypothetical protein